MRQCSWGFGVYWGRLQITLAALRWSIAKEFRCCKLLQPPHTTRPFKTEGRMTLKYKSNRTALFKNEQVQLVSKILLYTD